MADGHARQDPPSLPIEADERDQDLVDKFVERNRDALNESIARSRAEFAAGRVSKLSIEEIIEAGRRRHNRS